MMSGQASVLASVAAWEEACYAAAIFAVDPPMGGVLLHAGAGPVRDAWLAALRGLLPEDTPMIRAPAAIGDGRLLGGLDLTATLRAGRPVAETGVLAQAHGGILVLAMAERLPKATAARIAGVMDSGQVLAQRDGVALAAKAMFGVVALDEGDGDDETPPAGLVDHLALRLDLNALSYRACGQTGFDKAEIADARLRLAAVPSSDSAIEALTTVAAQFGVDSFRAVLQALRVARIVCALRDGGAIDQGDIAVAARFVLAPRATMMPPAQQAEPEQPSEPAPEPPDNDAPETPAQDGPSPDPQPETAQDLPAGELNDLIVAAALAAIPAGLLARIQADTAARTAATRSGKAGAGAASSKRGRPLPARRGALRNGRLGLVDTLRAAAPWQTVRRRAAAAGETCRVIVRPDDFRIVRFRERTESVAIFVVDASGSSAVQRLAEVKGAIELLLVDCYVRRDAVAMIAFRGRQAEIVLPPTRSLTRAKRTLAGLPGGGGTPIAAALDAALLLADSIRRKGQSPLLVLMTDGRANVGRNGAQGRAQAFEDALAAAKGVASAGIATLAIDTAPPQQSLAAPPTLLLGQAMNARYIRLPQADAAKVSEAVRAATARN